MIMSTPAQRWTAGPCAPVSRRVHGTLDEVTDSERRALRPVGATAGEVAARTGALLAELLALPDVRLFQGVRPAAGDLPPIPHVVCAGRRIILVESVAWPPGRYTAGGGGRIHCDGMYIGQSVRPLASAVRHWRGVLPRSHRVSALVVVHPAPGGDLTLPDCAPRGLHWARACEAVGHIRAALPAAGQATSVRALAALVAATSGHDGRQPPRPG